MKTIEHYARCRENERKNNGTAGQTFTTDEIVKRREKKKTCEHAMTKRRYTCTDIVGHVCPFPQPAGKNEKERKGKIL